MRRLLIVSLALILVLVSFSACGKKTKGRNTGRYTANYTTSSTASNKSSNSTASPTQTSVISAEEFSKLHSSYSTTDLRGIIAKKAEEASGYEVAPNPDKNLQYYVMIDGNVQTYFAMSEADPANENESELLCKVFEEAEYILDKHQIQIKVGNISTETKEKLCETALARIGLATDKTKLTMEDDSMLTDGRLTLPIMRPMDKAIEIFLGKEDILNPEEREKAYGLLVNFAF